MTEAQQNEEEKKQTVTVGGPEQQENPTSTIGGEMAKENYLEYSINYAMGTLTAKIVSISLLSITVIIYAVVMIYFGVYAYGNPDPPEAFFVDGVESTRRTRAAIIAEADNLGVDVRPGYPINIATLFRSWFMWGFWGSVFQVALIATLIPLCFLIKSQISMLNIIGGIVQGVICCNNIAWFFLGFFWRFSRAGRVASGEKLERGADLTNQEWQQQKETAQEEDGYQLKSGAFLSAYLWILIAIFLLTIVGGSVYAVMGCTQPNDSAKQNEAEATQDGQTKGGDAEAQEQTAQ